MWIYWLIAAGLFFIAEIITVGFLVFWLGIGALAAMCVSFFTSNIIIQTAVFVVVSTLLIFLTKPLVDKYISKKETVPTNAYSVIGKTGTVIAEIKGNTEVGQVKVDGEIWSAISNNSYDISKGSEVIVDKIDGVKLIVTPVKVMS